MSASEKLKALEALAWPGGSATQDESARAIQRQLRDALPQIVAVVEAAEAMTNPDGVVRHGDMSFTRLTPAEVIGPALTALDEALGGDVT